MCTRTPRVGFIALSIGVLGGALQLGASAAAASPSPTTAHVYLQTKVGRYSASVIATQAPRARAATLVVYLKRGSPSRDQQTHTFSFTLRRGAVTVDRRLGGARISAGLGSFGTVRLAVRGRGRTSAISPPGPCSGPATLSRAGRPKGRISIRLGRLGTLRSPGRATGLDRASSGRATRCRQPPCRRYAGTRIAGLTSGPSYLSIQADGQGQTYVFGAVTQRLRKPTVFVNHTRFALGGSVVSTSGPAPGDRTITLTGSGPASGSLSFSGPGPPEVDRGCAGHHVRRLSGRVRGSLRMAIDGVGVVSATGDGSAGAPLGVEREQVD